MLERATIDGFRSLIGFNIEMEAGLQVLVGANGAGKSNFVEFLDFLGELLSTDLDSAIAVAEGAGSLFSRERHTRDNAHLRFSLCGVSSATGRRIGTEQSVRSVRYKYEAHIRYDKRIPSIYINKETVTVYDESGGEFKVDRYTDYDSGLYSNRFKFNSKKHDYYESLEKSFIRYHDDEESEFSLEKMLSSTVSSSQSLLRRLSFHDTAFDTVFNDLVAFRSINIEPASARLSSPVSREGGIKRTGENLALALYKMAKGEYYGTDYWWVSHGDWSERQKIAFKSIINWCRELNPEISKVEAELDLAEAVLKPQMQFQFSDRPFAFSRISDGTVKWVALVAMMFAERQFSVIEEPENFLHPRMQEGIINLSRESLERKPKDSQFIMSTHSQTVLDMCQPYEVIIFYLENGQTRAKRPKDVSQLQSLLRESDFGIGHLYKMGVLGA